jgi:nucleotide-binding universal stress UspA family protein
MKELSRRQYDLVVLGGIDRGHDNQIYLGNTIQTVLARAELPALLLVAHER